MKRQQGAVLPVVLILLAIMMTVIFAVVAQVDNERDRLLAQQERQQAAKDVHTTLAVIKYLLATRPLNRVGLVAERFSPFPLYQDVPFSGKELLFDGRYYRGVGQASFSIQDQSGLVPVNFSEEDYPLLGQLLAAEGISLAEQQRLQATMADYIDPDDQRRLYGAEAADYRRAGLPDPPNRSLQLEHELAFVMGWQQAGLIRPDFLEKVTILTGGWVNLNTSPLDVLALHPRLTKLTAKRIVDGRPWSSIRVLNERLGLMLTEGNAGEFAYYPGSVIKLRLRHPELIRDSVYFMKLQRGHGLGNKATVAGKDRAWFEQLELSPWHVMYVLDQPATGDGKPFEVYETGVKLFEMMNDS